MSLPARVLRPQTRAIGMGLFFTVYYAAMMLGPVVGGACAKWAGSAARRIRLRRGDDPAVSAHCSGASSGFRMPMPKAA